MYRTIQVSVVILSVFHIVMGTVSICVGTVSSIQAVVWMAHRVSPIWSGAFFIITGILGFACVKRQTAYIILCFTAFSIVSLVTAVVSIQLLRLGLVNHTTDGMTYRKETLNPLLLVALGADACECLVCIVSSFVSCQMAKLAKVELYRKREGMFHVEIYGEKDVVVVTKSSKKHQQQKSAQVSRQSRKQGTCCTNSMMDNSENDDDDNDLNDGTTNQSSRMVTSEV